MQLTLNNEGSGELYLQIMKAICGDTEGKSMVDLGCHTAPYTAQLGFVERTYVDIQNRGLDFKDDEQYFIKMDTIEFMQQGKYFDTAIASDHIEHLSLRNGKLLVHLMEQYSGKQIIFTPLGKYMVTKDTHPDSHQSGWSPDYFQGWANIVLPKFHPSLNIGAFFSWYCEDIKEDFKRVKKELSWIK